MSNKIYCLYHSNCYDGFGAAYGVWKALKGNVKCLPVSYGYPYPEEIKEAKPDMVYIVDFSYPKEVLLDLKQHCKQILLIDHHKTAQENLKDLTMNPVEGIDVIFDMARSGALLTWMTLQSFAPVPKLIQHISDRDLWKFEMEGSKEIHAYLCGKPFDFDLWDIFTDDQIPTMIEVGRELLAAKLAEVEKICKSAWIGKVCEHEVPIVNTSAHWSEVGHLLLEKFPEHKFAVSFTVFKDQVMYSLRCRDDFDVSEIAKQFGGGGHKQAAGFKVPTMEPSSLWLGASE